MIKWSDIKNYINNIETDIGTTISYDLINTKTRKVIHMDITRDKDSELNWYERIKFWILRKLNFS